MAALVLLFPLAMRRPFRVILASYAVVAVVMGLLWLAREPIVVHSHVAIRVIWRLAVAAFVTYIAIRVFTRLVLRDSVYYGALIVGSIYLGTQFLILSDSRVRLEGPPPPAPPADTAGRAGRVH
jgi:hypothetical protein